MKQYCIYCDKDINGYESKEHVLPDYLGCPIKLNKNFVCSGCNSTFNKELHLPFREYLLPILAALGIKTEKRGTLPFRVAEFKVNGKPEMLKVTVNGFSQAKPSVTKSPNGDYEVIARTEKEFDKLFRQFKKKRPDAVIKKKSLHHHPPPETEIVNMGISIDLLYKIFSQFTINCLVYWYGKSFINLSEFINIKNLAVGEPSTSKIRLEIRKNIDINRVEPIILAVFIPNSPNIVKINIFDFIEAKIPLNCDRDVENRFFIIDPVSRTVIKEN